MLPRLETTSGPSPTHSLIILHGLGADGADFLPVCQRLDLQDIGDVRFVMPSAPAMPVSINNGYVMPAWYDIRPPGPLPREDEAGMRTSLIAIHALIDRELARGVPTEHIVLMGFSQGCAMALMAGLRYPQRLAGLIGLSGYLPVPERTAQERHPANADTPIFIGHGLDDDVVPLARGQLAHATLKGLGHPMTWHDYPIDHTLCLDEIADIEQWLHRVWPPSI